MTKEFEAYAGGVFHQFSPFEFMLNHEISVVGWGKQGPTEYWIGRNSWGNYWGCTRLLLVFLSSRGQVAGS